jgi:hypothetical protein
MFYPKNVPNWERLLRLAGGLILVAIALINLFNLSPLVLAVLLFSAIFAVVTGFIGWCPACAMVGRKLKNSSPKSQVQ